MIKKSVLIIGGSSDIGKAIAVKFASNGYDVILTYNNGSLNDVEQKCNDLGAKCLKMKLNVLDKKNFEVLFEQIKNRVDYLDSIVYCAGVSLSEKLLMDEKNEDIDEIIDVNLKGAIYCSKYAMKYFSFHNYGSIIFISSIYGIYGGSCESVYSASKGGLIALAKSLSQECANFNVRVNCVSPGFIDTKMTKRFKEEEKKDIIALTPLNKLGEAEDVAKVVYFLASDESSFITGENITVSGGAIKF